MNSGKKETPARFRVGAGVEMLETVVPRKNTPARIRKSTGVENASTNPNDTIFSAVQSAAEFHQLTIQAPPIIQEMVPLAERQPGGPTHRDVSRPLWLRRAFGAWLDDFCARFAGSQEVVEKMSVCIKRALDPGVELQFNFPGFLIGWPMEVDLETLQAAPERLDTASTWKIKEAILARVGMAFIAHGRRHQWEPELSIIQRTMKVNPGLSNWDICAAVDDECERANRPIPVPPKCKQHGHKTLKDSIECTGDCRSYMAVFLAQERNPLNLPKSPQSKLPPKSKLKS